MSNPNPPGNEPPRRNPQDDALAALHNMHNPPPGSAETPNNTGEPSASGFVGMLAKGQPVEPDPLTPLTPQAPPAERPTPQPVAPDAASQERDYSKAFPLGQAREIRPPQPAAATPARRPAAPRRKVPAWYRPATPIMFTIGSLLFLVGIWAVGAVIAINVNLQSFPLLGRNDPDADIPGFDPLAKFAAYGMLVALPVAIAMIFMGFVMHRHIAAADEGR